MHRIMGRKRKWVTGWRFFFLAVAALFGFWLADDRFARASSARGFYPPDTYCMVSSWDFPRAWTDFGRGDVTKRLREDWPRPFKELELATRLAAGIRPTPARWSLWLGRRTVFAFAPEGAGVTAYPGSLLRCADALRGAFGYGPGADGIAMYRGYSYAWRDGYLVASPSRAYVEAALSSGDSAPRLHSDNDALLTVQWEGAHRGFANAMPGKGLPVSGQIEFTGTDGARPITLPQAWPELPIVSLTARDVIDVEAAWLAVNKALEGDDRYAEARAVALSVLRAWGLQAPNPHWGAGVDHVSIALLDTDAPAEAAVPGAAIVLRYAEEVPEANPFAAILASRQTVPFDWNGHTGFKAPLLGTEWSPCVAKTRHEWILTTQGSVMAELAGRLADGPACAADVDIALRASWEGLAARAESVALRLGEAEALPRMNIEDVRAVVLPKIAAVSKLGEIAVDGVVREGTLKFSGHLAKAGEDGSP